MNNSGKATGKNAKAFLFFLWKLEKKKKRTIVNFYLWKKTESFGILHAFICSSMPKMNAFCFLFTDALLLTLQLTNIYGNIYTVWMGQTPVVVLNGYKAVKDAIVTHSEETSGRPLTPFYRDMMGEKGVTIPKYAYLCDIKWNITQSKPNFASCSERISPPSTEINISVFFRHFSDKRAHLEATETLWDDHYTEPRIWEEQLGASNSNGGLSPSAHLCKHKR